MQYDTGVLALPSVLSEVKAFPALLAWVSKQAATPGSKLYKVANPAAPLVSGHSRGGKIAGLVFADNPQVKAAWLIDPIDASQFAPISPDNPSAAQAIKAANRPIGVTGAGVLSSCNPTEGNYAVMYAAGAPGSWEELIPGASHSLFSDGGSVINLAQDTLCGRGKISRTQVAELTTTPLLAWYWKQLQAVGVNQGPATNPLPAFDAWVKAQEKKGLIKFNVKGAPKAEDLVTEAPMQQDVALAAAHRALIVP